MTGGLCRTPLKTKSNLLAQGVAREIGDGSQFLAYTTSYYQIVRISLEMIETQEIDMYYLD